MISRGSSPSRSVCCTRLLSSSDATPSSTEQTWSPLAGNTDSIASSVQPPTKMESQPEEALFLFRQQVVAPLEGVAQRLLPLREILCPARQTF